MFLAFFISDEVELSTENFLINLTLNNTCYEKKIAVLSA